MFRPVLEILERREVFSANPLADMALSNNGHGAGDLLPIESSNFVFAGNGAATSGANGLILPYIEQENVYRSSNVAMDRVQGGDATQSQIIAILIGLRQDEPRPQSSVNSTKVEFADTVPKDQTMANRGAAAGHDAVFAEIGTKGCADSVTSFKYETSFMDGTSNTLMFGTASAQWINGRTK